MKQKARQPGSVQPRFRVYYGEDIALGPGKVELLEHIQKTGSIAEAARCMGMSYNRAWLLVRTMNGCFQEPVVAAERGGSARGGAQLTKTGQEVLALYHQLEAETVKATRKTGHRIQTFLKQ
jgi:molybdate transport system regulatory protein